MSTAESSTATITETIDSQPYSPRRTIVDTERPATRSALASLEIRDFRLFLTGLLVSGTGAWVQRIAQDWLVLTMTDSATAVGITTACQFLPTLALGLHGGALADRFPKRRLLQVTQTAMALMAAVLGVLTLTGRVELWHVFLLAFGLGAASAIDNPVRQSFVTEIVGPRQLRSAISIVASTFQLGAMLGPMLSGVLLSAWGPGWAFVANALSYAGPLAALAMMRPTGPPRRRAGPQDRTSVRDGLRYAASQPTVLWPTVMVGTFGFFTISLPVTLAAFAKHEFGSGPGGLGLLNGAVAAGALVGAVATARRSRAIRLRSLTVLAVALAAAQVTASFAPNQMALMVLMTVVGAANLALLTSAQSLVQLTVPDHLRGRVVGIYLLALIGSGALGGPVVGLVDEHFGPRVGLLMAGVVPAVVMALVARHLADRAGVRLGLTRVDVSVLRPAVVTRHHG